ncbi:MAG: hypothetical protein M3P48_11240, partial [Actinomycetota bacterium]|nr:hypothetical protein [Actinomycetota bacterium]
MTTTTGDDLTLGLLQATREMEDLLQYDKPSKVQSARIAALTSHIADLELQRVRAALNAGQTLPGVPSYDHAEQRTPRADTRGRA